MTDTMDKVLDTVEAIREGAATAEPIVTESDFERQALDLLRALVAEQRTTNAILAEFGKAVEQLGTMTAGLGAMFGNAEGGADAKMPAGMKLLLGMAGARR